MPALITDRTAEALATLLREPGAPARAGGAILSAPWAVECGTLIGTSPRPHYNATVQLVGALSGPTDSPGATNGVVLAELNGGTLTPGRVYLAHPGGVTTAGKPILWTDASGGNRTPSGSDSCGWVAALSTSTCLRVRPVSAVGLCGCTDLTQDATLRWDATDSRWESGAADWTSCGTAGTGQINFTRGTPPAVPQLTIDGYAGHYLGCDGSGGLLFAFGIEGGALCPTGVATECSDYFVVKVECACCPIDGWEGEAWYCVRDAGTEDPCVPLYLDEADRCDSTIEICTGPYDTEMDAEAVCGTPPASVEVACSPTPQTVAGALLLTATVPPGSTGTVVTGTATLNYVGESGGVHTWQGSGTFSYTKTPPSGLCDNWSNTVTWRIEATASTCEYTISASCGGGPYGFIASGSLLDGAPGKLTTPADYANEDPGVSPCSPGCAIGITIVNAP